MKHYEVTIRGLGRQAGRTARLAVVAEDDGLARLAVLEDVPGFGTTWAFGITREVGRTYQPGPQPPIRQLLVAVRKDEEVSA